MVQGVGKFQLLGQCLDNSPGEALDKCARYMRLDLHPDVQGLVGGAAIERLAERGDPEKIQLMFRNAYIMQQRCVCLCM